MQIMVPGLAAQPRQATVPGSHVARTHAAAQQFEAQVLGALLQPMFENVGPGAAFGGGTGEAQWRPMLVTEYGKAIARAGGVGLAGAVLAALQGVPGGRRE
jgi:hypothetical protein